MGESPDLIRGPCRAFKPRLDYAAKQCPLPFGEGRGGGFGRRKSQTSDAGSRPTHIPHPTSYFLTNNPPPACCHTPGGVEGARSPNALPDLFQPMGEGVDGVFVQHFRIAQYVLIKALDHFRVGGGH